MLILHAYVKLTSDDIAITQKARTIVRAFCVAEMENLCERFLQIFEINFGVEWETFQKCSDPILGDFECFFVRFVTAFAEFTGLFALGEFEGACVF